MEPFLIEIIAERALQSKERVMLELKEIKGLKDRVVNGRIVHLTERYMILSVGGSFERVIFLEWVNFIEVMETSE